MAKSSSSALPILCASFNQDNRSTINPRPPKVSPVIRVWSCAVWGFDEDARAARYRICMVLCHLSYLNRYLIALCSCFAVGTRDGFRIFDAQTGRLCYERCEIFQDRALVVIMLVRPWYYLVVKAWRVIWFPTAIGAFSIVEMLFSSSLLAIVGAGEQVMAMFRHFGYIFIFRHIFDLPRFHGWMCSLRCLRAGSAFSTLQLEQPLRSWTSWPLSWRFVWTGRGNLQLGPVQTLTSQFSMLTNPLPLIFGNWV